MACGIARVRPGGGLPAEWSRHDVGAAGVHINQARIGHTPMLSMRCSMARRPSELFVQMAVAASSAAAQVVMIYSVVCVLCALRRVYCTAMIDEFQLQFDESVTYGYILIFQVSSSFGTRE